MLRAVAARPEVGAVGAIGYSEGALHAAWLAAHTGAAAVVLLGCTALPGQDVMLRWAERLRTDEIPWPVRLLLRLLRRTPRDQVARLCAKLIAATGTTLPDLTHLLRRDPGPATIRNYREQYRHPVDASLLAETADWVAAHLPGQTASTQD